MTRVERLALGAALVLTGFSALALQVVWQRIISLHAGADVAATSVVVAGFLAGLGIGNLLGGRIADASSRRRSLVALAGAEAGVAVVAAVSTFVFHDLIEVAVRAAGAGAGRVLAFALLLVPTTLMGLSLPLVSRAVTTRAQSAGSEVGRFYALNTAGGAVGAFVAGWHLVGRLGYLRTTILCAVLGAVAAAVFAVLSRRVAASDAPIAASVPADTADEVDAPPPTSDAQTPDAGEAHRPGVPTWGWYLLYGVSGALALGLQQAFFRFVGAVSRSNSYSFATVLAIYLALFAVGAATGARLVRRVADARRWFLGLQFAAGASALAIVLFAIHVLPFLGFGDRFDAWFNSDGFASGYDLSAAGDLALFGLGLPALIVGPPVFLMGASFPFVERIVVDRLGRVGRRTGGLLAANTFGNVVGTLAVGFVAFGALGTAGTFRVLALALLLLAGAGAVLVSGERRPRLLPYGALVIGALALLVAFPDNQRLWGFLSGRETGHDLVVAEDAACASVLKRHSERDLQLSIGGATQNGYPFDDFHILLGLLPSLAHERPEHGLAIGFGIGSTSYALLSDAARDEVTSVELCAGHYEIADRLADEGYREFVELEGDRRHRALVGDGRHHLLRTEDSYDVVVVDTLRPTSANSGQHFSREFYELVDGVMSDDGILAQWVPTWRVLNSAGQVFPHVSVVTVSEYNSSVMMLASRSPLVLDPVELSTRFEERAAARYEPEQQGTLRQFLSDPDPTCVTDGQVTTEVDPAFTNTDLHPRDEYHYNNGFIGETQVATTCPDGWERTVDGG